MDIQKFKDKLENRAIEFQEQILEKIAEAKILNDEQLQWLTHLFDVRFSKELPTESMGDLDDLILLITVTSVLTGETEEKLLLIAIKNDLEEQIKKEDKVKDYLWNLSNVFWQYVIGNMLETKEERDFKKFKD